MTEVRVLLVDDEPHVLSALQRVFRRESLFKGRKTVTEAFESPHEALERVIEKPADVVVCDYRMPDMNGIELLRQVRQLQPYAGRVLLTGMRDFDTVLEAINVAQVGRLVPKPWDELALVEAVREVAELRRLQLENAELADQLRVQRGQLSKQEAELRRIEAMWPGITRVEWGTDGSITISERDIV